MILNYKGKKVLEVPVHGTLAGIRIDSLTLTYLDLNDLYKSKDEELRFFVNHLLTRFAFPEEVEDENKSRTGISTDNDSA